MAQDGAHATLTVKRVIIGDEINHSATWDKLGHLQLHCHFLMIIMVK